MTDRQPPQDKAAEANVLGSMLRDNAVIHDVMTALKADHFYYDAHQKIFTAITDLTTLAKPSDLVSVFNALKRKKQTEDVGGAPYLAELWDNAPTAFNAHYNAAIIREHAIVRSLIHAHTERLRDAYDGIASAEELLASSERSIMEIADKGATGETVTLKAAMKLAFNRLDERATGGANANSVRTGYLDLDKMTCGLQNSEVTIIAARPSIGKTMFALNIVRNVIVDGLLPVYFVSLEQTKAEIAERLLVCQSRVDSHDVRSGRLSRESIERMMEAQSIMIGSEEQPVKLFIDDSPSQSLLRISATARRLKMREGIRLVVLDYLQLIEPEDRKSPRQEQVSALSRRLKYLARELEIPVVCLAQVNRNSEDRADPKPRLSDLRESGAIEQDADTVFILHRPGRHDASKPDNTLEIQIAKQRNGPPGEVTLSYAKESMRFDNLTLDTTARQGNW